MTLATTGDPGLDGFLKGDWPGEQTADGPTPPAGLDQASRRMSLGRGVASDDRVFSRGIVRPAPRTLATASRGSW